MSSAAIAKAQEMAAKVVTALQGNGKGWGLFGVEFFIKGEEVIFSELSPRPHDTGMVTLVSQDLTEFDLHARAIMGLPVPAKVAALPSASAVILADRDGGDFSFDGLHDALMIGEGNCDVRLFGKPVTRPYRRMGVALARAETPDDARSLARQAAKAVRIVYRH
jgi:phosphoribosylglycinamide formyltransferase 2